jgi:hypothetical protein
MKKKRARTDKGLFIADNPETVHINEAWVHIPKYERIGKDATDRMQKYIEGLERKISER